MQLHFGFPVLQSVGGAFGLVGESSFFSQRNEADAEFVGHRRSKKKPARIDSNNLVDLLTAALLEKNIDRRAKQAAIFQDRRDVFENDSLLWKIGHVAYGSTQPFYNL